MLFYHRISKSEGIDLEKNGSKKKKSEKCHFWFFTEKYFIFQQYLCDGCHEITLLAHSINKVAILKIDKYHYRCYFPHMTKEEAKNKLKNVDFNLNDKKGFV